MTKGFDRPRVHGMQNDEVAPDWPPLEIDELTELFDGFAPFRQRRPRVTWRAPRPMSTSALVTLDETTVFVKRHHRDVRDRERLALEHHFSDHLRARGIATPAVWRRDDGDSVTCSGDYVYEVFDLATGADRYAEVASWLPYQRSDDAFGAGAALAMFHDASGDFLEAASPFAPLMDSTVLLSSPDPSEELHALLAHRPALREALAHYPLAEDFDTYLREPLANAREVAREQAAIWTHGDWHPSNLTWYRDGTVASVIDLGLANRTFALRDLAVAIERATIDWLDVHERGDYLVDTGSLAALLGGYHSRRALSASDRDVLAAVLPVVHVEFALSEVEYFGAITKSTINRDLAYHDYLLGHARWFTTPSGERLLAMIRA